MGGWFDEGRKLQTSSCLESALALAPIMTFAQSILMKVTLGSLGRKVYCIGNLLTTPRLKI